MPLNEFEAHRCRSVFQEFACNEQSGARCYFFCEEGLMVHAEDVVN